jgi:ATP-dependent DNA helicase RecQ
MQDVALRRQMIENGESPELQKRVEIQKLNALLGYCEASSCRRRILLQYFGDEAVPCGNCDTCANPPKTFDGLVAAQKALSCIVRTGQRFGASYVIDVLLGEENDERIQKFGHNTLSTFGIGKDYSKKEWQSILRQLLSHNLIFADMNDHGGLKLTDPGAELLRGKGAIQLRFEEKPARGERKKSRSPAADITLENEADKELFHQLRALRLSIAREQNLPPYVIFHDRTLMEMALQKPAGIEEFSRIGGVGQSKLEKYGEIFLKTINPDA